MGIRHSICWNGREAIYALSTGFQVQRPTYVEIFPDQKDFAVRTFWDAGKPWISRRLFWDAGDGQ